MKIMLVPDIHLGVKSHGKDFPNKLNSRIKDRIDLMEFVYDKCIENKINRMILLGDIFEKEEPEPILLSIFFEWLSKCTDHMFVDIVMGNHDYKRVGNNIITILDCVPAARIKNCKIYKTIETNKFDELSITYVPFIDRRQSGFDKNEDAIKDILSKIDLSISNNQSEKNICVGHMAIEKSIYVGDEIDDEFNELFLPTTGFSKFNYCWMGHIHKPQILHTKPYVAHLGSLDKRNYDEGDKFICIYDSDTNRFKDIKLPCRQLVDISIIIPTDVKDTTEYIKQELKKIETEKNIDDAILRIKVEITAADASSIDKKEIDKFFVKMNIQHVSEFVEKKKTEAISLNMANIDETMDPYKAVDLFLESVEADDNFKKEVAAACKEIIKEAAKEK